MTTAAEKKIAPPPLPLSTTDMISSWRSYLTINLNRSPGTTKVYAMYVAEFAVYLAEQDPPIPLLAATPHHIEAWQPYLYQQRRNLAGQSRATKLAAIRGFFAWALRSGRIPADPSKGIPTPTIVKHLPRRLTDDQLKALFATPDRSTPLGLRDLAMLAVLYCAGLRASELTGLDTTDIILTPPTVRLHVRGKGRKERILSIRPPAARIVLAHAAAMPPGPLFITASPSTPGQRLRPEGLNRVLKKYGARIGIKAADIFAHLLRSTFATTLHEEGHDVVEISRQMGHTSVNTTMGYIAISSRTIERTTIPAAKQKALGLTLED